MHTIFLYTGHSFNYQREAILNWEFNYNITEFNIQFLKSIISNDKHYTLEYCVFNQNLKK